MEGLLVIQASSVSTTSIFTAKPISAEGYLTLNGTVLDVNPIGRKLLITSTGDDSGVYFTVIFKAPGGGVYVETLKGSNGGTAVSVNYMNSIVSIHASGPSGANVSIGSTITGGYVSKPYLLGISKHLQNVGIQVNLVGSLVSMDGIRVFKCLTAHTASFSNCPIGPHASLYWQEIGVSTDVPLWVSGASYISTNSGINYRVQYSMTDWLHSPNELMVWQDSDETASNQTSDGYFNFALPVMSTRIISESITTGGIIAYVGQTS